VNKAIVSMVLLVFVAVGVCIAGLQTTRSVRDGVFTQEQQKRGSDQFMNNCSMCHGADMNGGEEAPALFGGNFMSDWNGLTVGDLAERIRRSMPPSDPEMINAQQRADIIALILNANGFPAGPKELDSRIEFMKQIKIEPK
jgi:mono/diheme cytochrome c family protein